MAAKTIVRIKKSIIVIILLLSSAYLLYGSIGSIEFVYYTMDAVIDYWQEEGYRIGAVFEAWPDITITFQVVLTFLCGVLSIIPIFNNRSQKYFFCLALLEAFQAAVRVIMGYLITGISSYYIFIPFTIPILCFVASYLHKGINITKKMFPYF